MLSRFLSGLWVVFVAFVFIRFWLFLLMSFPDYSKISDIPQYWYATVSAVIGSAIALYFAKRQTAADTHKAKATAKEALIDRLQFNDDRLKQLSGQFSRDGEPNYPLDTTGLIIWLSLSQDVLDTQLIKDLNWHRYQLDHINTKLHTYYLLIAATDPESSVYCKAREQEARESIEKHLKIALAGTPSLLQRLKEQ